jgi:hypothetical protein
MNRPIRIEDWSIVQSGDAYTAPELRSSLLVGKVFGHPNFRPGEKVTSSPIRQIRGGIVETMNRKYVLGRVSPEYRDWANKKGIKLPEVA